jgi:glycosyltransferase involved in cell wall biosynthesis
MEAEAIRRYGLKQPIAVIPNGVDVPDDNVVHSRELMELRFSRLRERRWLLFMGRLDPKKGVDILLDAWRSLHRDFPDWHLVIAGPDLVGLTATLVATVSGNDFLRKSITFTGMLDGELKRSALANADVFILPTLSENFGIAVAEALAFGTPVVTTTAAPWADIVAYDCGWWVAPERAEITDALRSAMSRSPDQLGAQGQRGRQLVSERYSWDSVGSLMVNVYRWILSGGIVPECVRES